MREWVILRGVVMSTPTGSYYRVLTRVTTTPTEDSNSIQKIWVRSIRRFYSKRFNNVKQMAILHSLIKRDEKKFSRPCIGGKLWTRISGGHRIQNIKLTLLVQSMSAGPEIGCYLPVWSLKSFLHSDTDTQIQSLV